MNLGLISLTPTPATANVERALSSRGTLSANLKELEEEGMMQRRVVASKPIESYYSLREKGREIAKQLNEIQQVILTAHG